MNERRATLGQRTDVRQRGRSAEPATSGGLPCPVDVIGELGNVVARVGDAVLAELQRFADDHRRP